MKKFRESKIMISGHVYEYPVVLLEKVLRKVGSLHYLFNKLTGKYVFIHYLDYQMKKTFKQKISRLVK